jgi:hypothetical protein
MRITTTTLQAMNKTDHAIIDQLFNKFKARGSITSFVIQPDQLTSRALLFRGDARSPSEIFKNGFSLKNCNTDSVVVRVRPKMLRTETGVCLAKNLKGASYFPMPNPANPVQAKKLEHSFIYLVQSDKTFDTSRFMARVIAHRDDCKMQIREENYMRDLAFAEVSTPKVLPNEILMAIELLDRKVTTGNSALEYAVSAKVVGYHINPDADIAAERVEQVVSQYPIGTVIQTNTSALSEEVQTEMREYTDMRNHSKSENK